MESRTRLLSANNIPLTQVKPAPSRMAYYRVRDRMFAYDVQSMAVVQITDPREFDAIQRTYPAGHTPYINARYRPQQHDVFRAKKPVSIVLHTTQTCNLSCSYCFLEHEYVDGLLDTRKGRMSFETARRAIDELLDWERGEAPQIGFFGGEPTLNWDVMVEATEYYMRKCALLKLGPSGPSVTTNGTTLTEERIRWLAKHNFGMIVSLDGTQRSQDTNRPRALPPFVAAKMKEEGKTPEGTYETVLKTLRLIRETAPQLSNRITLRGTFPWEGRKATLLEDTIALNDLVDEGLASWCSIEPAILTEKSCNVGPSEGQTFTPERVFEIYEDYLAVADWMAKRLNTGKKARFHQIHKFVERLLWGLHAFSECGAGAGYMSVDAGGSVYACHRQQHSFIGSLAEGVDPQLREKWLDNRTAVRPHCTACNLQYVCGGGCREESIGYNVTHHGMSPDEAIYQNYATMCNFKECWMHAALWVMSEVPRDLLAKLVHNPKAEQLKAIQLEHQRRSSFSIGGPSNRLPAAVKTCATCDC